MYRLSTGEIHDEKDDQRKCDREAGDIDGIGETEHLHEGGLTADEKVVDAPEPVVVAGVQHNGDALACEFAVGVDEVGGASARVHQLIPVAVHIDELIIEIDVGILVCRGEENVIDEERHGCGDFP